ncbi:adenylate/guanylate cyclase domain-containing protein [Ornithinimicrobium sp. F0845]|uniref:adenylate/guanylate cyclase domain-containing protein n=1 Tax=Ornithinimicrobium sp. F0845 TaxID=2926412 RepID=UPI001FF6E584|nr:adenylate/guanylate cyclase domain-containing protein [Ornithinimicrobium sp. F0845]MCK0110604.1 adenylate/guanylate cyclase domain-containing protein [Ornithinimicrobium sp. F0845]
MTRHRVGGRGPAALVAAVVAIALPLFGLALLLGVPRLDLHWAHHPAHFWLVLGTATLSAVLAYTTGDAAARRGDARLSHVSLAFLASSGFLGLHALATPGVLLDESNVGFAVATPIGVAVGSLFAVRSTTEFAGSAAVAEVALTRRLRWVLVAAMVLWGAVSLLRLPPLNGLPTQVESLPVLVAVPGVLLYVVAAWRYARLWRARRDGVLLAVCTAYILLAEALVAMALATTWRIAWWEWHVLLLVAFGLVVVGARRSWHEERFAGLYLDDTAAGHREASVLFADLQGFTTFSEGHAPAEVTAMLNDYFSVAVPAALRHGGDVDRIIGDALMVTFNKRGDQPDHALRAVRAGLALQEATGRVAERHSGWPRFRVGVNTGPISVGLLGTHGGRTHTVIGDTVNTASRIEGQAPAGGVAIGPATLEAIPGARTTPLGTLQLKGKAEPVETYLVLALEPDPSAPTSDLA